MIDEHMGIVGSTTGTSYYVRVLSTLDREKLKPSCSVRLNMRFISVARKSLHHSFLKVSLHRHSNSLVDILPPESDSSIKIISVQTLLCKILSPSYHLLILYRWQNEEKPDVSYSDIGGLDMQKQEIREAVELPLTDPQLYAQIGIDPPRGVLLYGPPGTGKTMLAKVCCISH